MGLRLRSESETPPRNLGSAVCRDLRNALRGGHFVNLGVMHGESRALRNMSAERNVSALLFPLKTTYLTEFVSL